MQEAEHNDDIDIIYYVLLDIMNYTENNFL